jgi:hypothetical protein
MTTLWGWVYFDEHSAAIIRTDDTWSRFELVSIRLDAEPLVVVEVGLEAAALSELSRVPLTSMRWPT